MSRQPSLDEYFECERGSRESGPPERYPVSHVRFSPTLWPIAWIDRAARLFGAHPFATTPEVLRAFDSARGVDHLEGQRHEIDRLRECVELMACGIDANPFISPIGRFLIKKMGVGRIVARRLVLEHYQEHRSFIERNGKLVAPVVITGTSRSGTTLLHRLISEDPNTRAPRTFEMEVPLPPLRADADPLADPRIDASEHSVGVMTRLARGFLEKLRESHVWGASEMEESLLYMFAHHGLPPMMQQLGGRRVVERFLEAEDKRPIFRYERLFFTMLDAYRPAKSHWTFKAPNYAPCFPLIFEEYPDARVVVTHRNPLVALPSLCRLMESWAIAFVRDGCFDKHRFGQLTERIIHRCLMVPLEYRKQHPEQEGRIFDCMYSELFADPIGMVKRVYEKFGMEYSPAFEHRMVRYLEDNKQGKYGRHTYSLEEYGFDAASLLRTYEPYMTRYGFDIPATMLRPTELGFGAPLG